MPRRVITTCDRCGKELIDFEAATMQTETPQASKRTIYLCINRGSGPKGCWLDFLDFLELRKKA